MQNYQLRKESVSIGVYNIFIGNQNYLLRKESVSIGVYNIFIGNQNYLLREERVSIGVYIYIGNAKLPIEKGKSIDRSLQHLPW